LEKASKIAVNAKPATNIIGRETNRFWGGTAPLACHFGRRAQNRSEGAMLSRTLDWE
jgi:hypothetical protein